MEMRIAKQAWLRGIHALAAGEGGSVFVEYLLLLTIVGIGAIAGLATLRGALTSELIDLANAIASITRP